METKTQDTLSYDASSAVVLAGKAQSALASASDFVIDSPTMFELASDDLKQVKALQKEVEEKRTSITGPLNQAVKAVNDLFRAPKEYLDKAEATLKRAMVTWTTEQERLAAIARWNCTNPPGPEVTTRSPLTGRPKAASASSRPACVAGCSQPCTSPRP